MFYNKHVEAYSRQRDLVNASIATLRGELINQHNVLQRRPANQANDYFLLLRCLLEQLGNDIKLQLITHHNTQVFYTKIDEIFTLSRKCSQGQRGQAYLQIVNLHRIIPVVIKKEYVSTALHDDIFAFLNALITHKHQLHHQSKHTHASPKSRSLKKPRSKYPNVDKASLKHSSSHKVSRQLTIQRKLPSGTANQGKLIDLLGIERVDQTILYLKHNYLKEYFINKMTASPRLVSFLKASIPKVLRYLSHQEAENYHANILAIIHEEAVDPGTPISANSSKFTLPQTFVNYKPRSRRKLEKKPSLTSSIDFTEQLEQNKDIEQQFHRAKRARTSQFQSIGRRRTSKPRISTRWTNKNYLLEMMNIEQSKQKARKSIKALNKSKQLGYEQQSNGMAVYRPRIGYYERKLQKKVGLHESNPSQNQTFHPFYMYLQRGATVTLLLVKEVPMSDKHGTQLSISQLYGQVLQYMIWHDILPTQSPEKEQVLREQLCNRIIVSQLHSSPLNKITIHESTDIAFNPYRNICETQTQPTNRLQLYGFVKKMNCFFLKHVLYKLVSSTTKHMGNQYDLNLLAKKFFNHRRVNAFPLMRSEKKLYDVLYSEIFESACNISEKSSDYFFRTIIKEEQRTQEISYETNYPRVSVAQHLLKMTSQTSWNIYFVKSHHWTRQRKIILPYNKSYRSNIGHADQVVPEKPSRSSKRVSKSSLRFLIDNENPFQGENKTEQPKVEQKRQSKKDQKLFSFIKSSVSIQKLFLSRNDDMIKEDDKVDQTIQEKKRKSKPIRSFLQTIRTCKGYKLLRITQGYGDKITVQSGFKDRNPTQCRYEQIDKQSFTSFLPLVQTANLNQKITLHSKSNSKTRVKTIKLVSFLKPVMKVQVFDGYIILTIKIFKQHPNYDIYLQAYCPRRQKHYLFVLTCELIEEMTGINVSTMDECIISNSERSRRKSTRKRTSLLQQARNNYLSTSRFINKNGNKPSWCESSRPHMHAEMTPLKLIVKKNSHVRVNTMSGSNSTDSLKKVRGSKFSDSINSSGSHLLTRQPFSAVNPRDKGRVWAKCNEQEKASMLKELAVLIRNKLSKKISFLWHRNSLHLQMTLNEDQQHKIIVGEEMLVKNVYETPNQSNNGSRPTAFQFQVIKYHDQSLCRLNNFHLQALNQMSIQHIYVKCAQNLHRTDKKLWPLSRLIYDEDRRMNHFYNTLTDSRTIMNMITAIVGRVTQDIKSQLVTYSDIINLAAKSCRSFEFVERQRKKAFLKRFVFNGLASTSSLTNSNNSCNAVIVKVSNTKIQIDNLDSTHLMSIDVGKIHDIFPYSRSMKSRNYKMFLKRILKSDGILREAVYYE